MAKGAPWRTFAAILAALPGGPWLGGCAPNHPEARPARSAGSASTAAAPDEGVSADRRAARWVLMPERAQSSRQRGATSPSRRIVDGVRVSYTAEGGRVHSSDFLPGGNIESLRLAPSLGGGFVFHSDVEAETAFWRAETWTAKATPLTRLPERADQIEVGFGRIYARLADSGETVAFDADTGKRVGLGSLPASPSYFDFQFFDDWFAVVHTDARGVLATFDGGMTWHATGITAEDASLSMEPDGIVISTSEQRTLLAPDGTWMPDYETLVSDSDESGPSLPLQLGKDPLELAVQHGAFVNALEVAAIRSEGSKSTHAVVANWGHVGLVDTVSGRLVDVRFDQYPGSQPCHAMPFGTSSAQHPRELGVALVCLLSSGETALYTVASDLSLREVGTWQTRVELVSSHNGVVIASRCPAAPETEQMTYCVFGAHESPAPLKLPEANGLERIVGLRDGRVAALIPPRAGNPGSLKLATLRDGVFIVDRTVALRFDDDTAEKLRTTAEAGLWLRDAGETDDGKLGFWIASANRLVGVTVALDGVVSVSRRAEADLRRTHLSGPLAFELSAGETAWQSLDYGRNWEEVTVPRGLTSGSTRETHDVVGCTAVGCSFGNWLRVGYDAVDSTVPTEVTHPDRLELRPSAYSQWSLECYPTGISEASGRGSGAQAYAIGQGRPRYGTSTGFLSATPSSSGAADVSSSANRPFLGVPRPKAPAGSFAFDMGADGTHQFRAYAWGLDGDAWRNSSAWLTRVADRFSVSGLWSTAPTRGPWPNLLTAAQLFGADRANRYTSSWQLSLDPSERAGVLRITTTGTTELHFIEESSATTSIGNTSFGPIAGVVKVQKTWYFGSQEGNRFHVYRVRNGNVEDFADFPIGDPVAPWLSRNTRGTELALVLRAPAGTWHVYPLSETGEALDPIVLGRDTLNTEWARCDAEALGYYVVGSLPLSRFTPNDGGEVLTLEAVPVEWKAEAVTARTIVSATSRCVDALAARLATTREPVVLTSQLPPKTGSIPLTLTDRLNDVRYGFRCLP